MMALTLQKVLLILALIILVLSLAVLVYSWYKVTGRKAEEKDINKSLIEVNDDGSLITDSDTIIKTVSVKKT